jgi:hypothetical protein
MYSMCKDKLQNCSLNQSEYIFTLYRYIQLRDELYSFEISLETTLSVC